MGLTKSTKESLTVKDNRTGKEYEIPIELGTVKATAFKQIQATPSEEGLRVYDNGFQNTAVCKSEITFIDGDKGILLYRGYPIEQLAQKSNFLEVAYLLIYGELPDELQFQEWETEIMRHTFVTTSVMEMTSRFQYDSHPFAIMISSLAALGAGAPEANPALAGTYIYKENEKLMNKQILRLIGKVPTLAAMTYRHRTGRPYNLPQNNLSYTENFLYMMDHLSETDYVPNPRLAKCLDTLFILHADHEVCASTAALRHVSSSLPDVYSSMAAAAASLYGPLHGGAAESVVRMLEAIGSIDNVPAYIEAVKRKEKLLNGFGHRVYTTFDPRSTVIRKLATEIFEICGEEPLVQVALELERVARTDDYFIKRNLYPNVDFFSGLCYKSMGFPTDFYPVLFLVPRIVGWIAHWREQLHSADQKIWRPRQVYVGKKDRQFVEIEKRQKSKAGVQSTAERHPFSKRTLAANWRGRPQNLKGKL